MSVAFPPGSTPVRLRVLAWGPVASYAALIFYISSCQSFPMETFISLHDKLLHAVEFGGFAVTAVRAFRLASRWTGRPLSCALLGALLAAGYALTDEFHQSFISGRSADTTDWLADATGALIAVLLFTPLYTAWLTARNAGAD